MKEGLRAILVRALLCSIGCRASYVLIVVLLFVCVFKVSFVCADDPAKKPEKAGNKIHITSDRLVTDNEAMFAEFIGNVVAIRETDVITSDRLKIFYKKGVDKKEKSTAGEEMIKKIVANGNVIIKFDDKVATAQQAVYTAETGVTVLTGPDSKVTSGNNFISGEKITMYRSDDHMIVEGGKEKRVEAVFYSKDNNIK
ncbi:MAG: LptA/OstA family protein [Desulfobacterales bacterium]|nr:LptA/OstA family protein [Desulfobacterales bacterium]